jgi:hypothetical protein
VKRIERLEGWEVGAGSLTLMDIAAVRVPAQSSPGLRWRKLGFTTKKHALPMAAVEATRILKGMRECSSQLYDVPPCKIGGRGKLVGPDKVGTGKDGRLIVIPDLVRHLLGSIGSKPYTWALKTKPKEQGGVMLGMGPFSSNYDRLARYNKLNTSFLMMDFSSFDSTVPSWLIRAALRLVLSRFKDLPPKYFDSEFRQLVNTRIAFPNGEVISKKGGIASGDPWTSIIGSYCNWIALDITMHHFGLESNIWVFGDDSLIGLKSLPPRVSVGDITDYLFSTFGLVAKPAQTWLTQQFFSSSDSPDGTSVCFLSSCFLKTPSCTVPVRSTEDMHNLLLHPESNPEDYVWEMVRVTALYLLYFFNRDAADHLFWYWTWLHKKFDVPDYKLIRRHHLGSLRELGFDPRHFDCSWLVTLPDPTEIISLYLYGYRTFFLPALGRSIYKDLGPSGITRSVSLVI